ncbi:DUF423 domain-containing protein [Polaribacter undariae]|uniref:DUF423 domain-containing protein n=1 Tax=Polaribacter sejongensis TaxID=985043 RepID=A0AAJ1VHG3_9FLAO|nr:DUF423 domain-containing protein [Polaribacter undariae]MDN3620788.1 DUF423 domain-containing protein [Polaribacter undariae]UWD31387.1 DUF423 domain-containing protein [Polaribacter undariae]
MFKNLIITCVLGMLAIVLGAFGAHALKEVLTSAELLSFETAVRYQMYHVIVLLFINIYDGFTTSQKNNISYIFFLGILLFSGSIYAIHLTPITAKSIWFVTPLGGLTLIIGWLLMIMIFLKKYRNSE